ncbi:MAG: hypothetical protein QM774_00795 [Gordonia sp. (in: high G+C Gram-positive bacteria)]|uniref:hypothetical protein n=1 Tax=Gordonia sp. (in: high G+C Gram-positive bacteria) TaxID=84139 RepID=UPI0039E636E2
MNGFRRPATIISTLAISAGAVFGGALGAGHAAADPGGEYLKSINCNVGNPYGGPRLRVFVDVWNKVRFPSDGLPGPAIELIASNPQAQDAFTAFKRYKGWTTVTWRNTSNGRHGVVRVPISGQRASWQAVLHPGSGHVNFTIKEKVSGVVMVENFNTQTRTCKSSAWA